MKIVVTLLAAFTLGSAPPPPPSLDPPAAPPPAGLTVLTYNVKGLPWPVATGRPEAFAKIAARLRAMRAGGNQPAVIVLQEAFTDEAKAIGRDAGYRHIVDGPSAERRDDFATTADDRRHVAGADWLRGEAQGKLLDSGLQILSDYPVLYTRRVAFPRFACAGYDCLANKGVLLVALDVPGSPVPVLIATTHLNARGASGVSEARSLYAFRRQVDVLSDFLAAHRDPRSPLIFAGDFNVSVAERRDYLIGPGTVRWALAPHVPVLAALDACFSPDRPCGTSLPPLAAFVREHARDWQFYTTGARASIEAVDLQIPFGEEPGGEMLSDHVGYGIAYRVRPAALGIAGSRLATSCLAPRSTDQSSAGSRASTAIACPPVGVAKVATWSRRDPASGKRST